MKIKIGTIICMILLSKAGLSQYPSIGGYNVYFGDMHNHSTASDNWDPTQTPEVVYTKAKAAGLDFFALTDHDSGSNYELKQADWQAIKTIANAANTDSFVAFYGFEWSSWTEGHINVIYDGTTSGDYCIKGSLANFITWLNARPNAIAFFNHPGWLVQANPNGENEFSHFNLTPSNSFVGIELWNSSNKLNHYYGQNSPPYLINADGYYTNDGNKNFFNEANNRGWKLGAWGGGDEHGSLFGVNYNSRVAILANSLTRADLFAAMKARRFYSTLDKNLCLSFRINGYEMGSSITATTGNNTFRIQAKDGNGEKFTQIVIYNQDQNQVYSAVLDEEIVDRQIDLNVKCNDDYFYVKVKQNLYDNVDEAISSPIWIVNKNIQSITLTSNANINGNIININNVEIKDNTNIVIDASEVNFASNFDVKIGSTLTVK